MDDRRDDAIALRLERLEESHRRLDGACRRWRRVGGLSLVVAVAATAAGARLAEKIREVEAEKFVLRDPEGRVRAILGLVDGGPRLICYDAEQRRRIGLGVLADGTSHVFL